MKYEAEIWYLDVICDADFNYGISSLINWQINWIWWRHHMKTWNCLYLGNRMKYKADICYVEVAYDANFGYSIIIRIICQYRSNLMTSSFEDNENINCQYLGDEIKCEAEIW